MRDLNREMKITVLVLSVILIISSIMQVVSCSVRRQSEKDLINYNNHLIDSLTEKIDSLETIVEHDVIYQNELNDSLQLYKDTLLSNE